MNENDTIAAIATPSGNSGIGIIRVSGSNAVKIADSIFRSKSGRELDLINKPSYTISYGFIFDEDKCIDEVLVSLFRSPKSYTAEDCVEINCHGGMYVLDTVLKLIIKKGARLALPGEFTKRAFMNGRIDLTEAEAVMDIISSENEFSRKNSLDQLRGSIKDLIISLREKLLSQCAYIEAALDDPEHYDLSGYMEELAENIKDMIKDADELISSSKDVRFLKDGIRVVIAGRPNVGKSSLLNLFMGYDRAIVTGEEGTTRDVIEERISLDGIILNIYDTAGIRYSENEAERIGIERARQYADRADLILLVIDSSKELDQNDLELFELVRDRNAIILLNKDDLESVTGSDTVKKYSGHRTVNISTKNNTGLNELKNLIKQMFYDNKISDNNKIYLTNQRQLDSFESARESLLLVLKGIESGFSEDVLTVDLMDAYSRLGDVIGQSTDDALADKIFEDFCMGK